MMFRYLMITFILTSAPALACDDLYDLVARQGVPLEDQSAYTQTFNACFEASIAGMSEEHQNRIPQLIDETMRVAVRASNVIVVHRMIEERARFGTSDNDDLSQLLLDAAGQGYTDIVRLLLGAGAGPNADDEIISPLYAAMMGGHADTARELIDAEGKVRRYPGLPEGVTLIEEVIYGSTEVAPTIEILIEQGHDPSERMLRGELPIHVAAALGDGETIRALHAGGANIEALDRQGHTPLETAASTFSGLSALPALLALEARAVDAAIYEAELNNRDMNIAYLKAIGEPRAQQATLDRALIAFIQRGRGDRIYKLLQAGANPNAFQGKSHPLYLTGCLPRIGEVLLEFGATPELARVNGAEPEWAAECVAYSEEARNYVSRLGFSP